MRVIGGHIDASVELSGVEVFTMSRLPRSGPAAFVRPVRPAPEGFQTLPAGQLPLGRIGGHRVAQCVTAPCRQSCTPMGRLDPGQARDLQRVIRSEQRLQPAAG